MYYPLSISGTVKTTEVAVELTGVTVVDRPVFLLERTTTGVPRFKLAPVRVIVPVVIELVEIPDKEGD